VLLMQAEAVLIAESMALSAYVIMAWEPRARAARTCCSIDRKSFLSAEVEVERSWTVGVARTNIYMNSRAALRSSAATRSDRSMSG
jgi:hypothetical protein